MSFWPLGSSRVEAGICGSRAELLWIVQLSEWLAIFIWNITGSVLFGLNIHLQEDQEDKA